LAVSEELGLARLWRLLAVQEEKMRFESCAFTDTGRRGNNEDAHLHEPALGVFGVADGMGGYAGGEIASQLVVETLEALYRRFRGDPEATFPSKLDPKRSFDENQLAVAIRLAHKAVLAHRVGELRDMGSTLVAMALRPGRPEAVIAHVGDSRIYRLRDGRFEALTRDHSLLEDLRKAGGATEMQSKADCPFANLITRALGLDDHAEPEVTTVDVRPGDIFLLCSDGLSDPLPEPKMAQILAGVSDRPGSVQRATEHLVRAAYEAGGKDNITAVTVRVKAA
jgi:serine/threonine protein phosphatase PrpC